MSYYYKYTFTSPESIYSLVKEEFKSYFDTGAVDDLLFPTYLDKCLKKLGRSSYIISEDVIEIDNFQGRLPDNFYAVREDPYKYALLLDDSLDGDNLLRYTEEVYRMLCNALDSACYEIADRKLAHVEIVKMMLQILLKTLM